MSFQLSDPNISGARLNGAILLYGSDSQTNYATIHGVSLQGEENQERPVIGPGRPVDRRAVAKLAEALGGKSSIKRFGFLPPHVLALGPDYVVWHSPAATRKMWFDTKSEILGAQCGEAPTPALVFAARGRELYVFAVKCKDRPTADTPLFHAPFLNTWDTSKVCTGSTPLPSETGVETVAAWEASFFRSYFSHTNHGRVVKYRGGAYKLWADLLAAPPAVFPNKVLVPIADLTVGAAITRLQGR